MNTLPTDLAGYQHLQPDVLVQVNDLLVRQGKPFAFVDSELEELSITVEEIEITRQCNVYRLIPVAHEARCEQFTPA